VICSTHERNEKSTHKFGSKPKRIDHVEGLWMVEINIRIDHRKRGWETVDCTHLNQNRNRWWVLVNTVLNVQVL
jgi:hypothetical protein